MKTLKIDTGHGKVTLTYSEVAGKWDVFSGSQRAIDTLYNMCVDMGWNWVRELKNYFTNFVADNLDKFVVEKTNEDVRSLF